MRDLMHSSERFATSPPVAALRAGACAIALALPFALALGGCELGLHEYQQATTPACQPWRTGCPAVLDYADAGAINPPRADIDRSEIVAAAADAPHRQCNTVSLVCQGRIIGDVLRDQYIMVLAGNPNASATAASSQPAQSVPASPPPAISPAGDAKPAASGRIVRTQGFRPGGAPQSTTSVPMR